MKHILVALGVSLLVGTPAFALQHGELSPAAQQLVPKGNFAVITLKSGEVIHGTVVMTGPDKVILKVKKSDTVSASRTVAKGDIKTMADEDVGASFAAKLLEWAPNPKQSMTTEEYKKLLALFDEFIAKCKGADRYDEVKARREQFVKESEKVSMGMDKVDGEWLPPVSAAIRKFDEYSKQYDELKKRPDFRTNDKVIKFCEGLIEQRRQVAKDVPEMMQKRVPELLGEKKFDEVIFETTAFLHFWIDQVVETEGAARDVLKGMDFGAMITMQTNIMGVYRQEKEAEKKPADVPKADNMVYIPGGYFIMGEEGDDPKKDTFPIHIVYVSPFLIDKYEVSNEEYRKFVDHVKNTRETWFEHPDAPPLKKHDAVGWNTASLNRSRQPVLGVDWYDAFAYARWVLGKAKFETGEMKRLPTEAEWEKAARGLDGRKYPWGNEDPAKLSINYPESRKFIAVEMDRQNPPKAKEPESSGCGCVKKADLPPPPPTTIPSETWEVDQLLPAKALAAIKSENFEWKKEYLSPYGLYHMAGNAAEWVHDFYDEKYYRVSPVKDPQGPDKPKERGRQVHVIRGGSFLDGKDALLAYRRNRPGGAAQEAGCTGGPRGAIGTPMVGFRCAKSLELVKPEDLRKDSAVDSSITFEDLMLELKKADEKTKRR